MSDAAKRRGRPRLPPGEGKRGTFTFRVSAGLRGRLEAIAQAECKSVSQVIEARLEDSFRESDLRAVVREEMQAALDGMLIEKLHSRQSLGALHGYVIPQVSE